MLGLRTVTAVVLLAVLLPILYFHFYPALLVLTGVFFAAASWECFRLFGNKKPRVGAMLWTAAFALLVYGLPFFNPTALFGVATIIWLLCLAPLLVTGLPDLEGGMNRSLNALYGVTIFAAFLALLYLFEVSSAYLLSIMALVWIADIGAYFFGKAFGKRKLAPAISPGKSWEGAIGGWVCVMLFSLACVGLSENYTGQLLFPHLLRAHFGWVGFVVGTTVLVVLSVVGDLFESMLKRRIGFKDSSQLLPGHGGVLDRIDALIPVLCASAFIHYYFTPNFALLLRIAGQSVLRTKVFQIMNTPQRITILGATGSIGASTLDVISRHPERYVVFALTAHERVQEMARLCTVFKPKVAVMGTAQAARELQTVLRAAALNTQVEYGPQALCEVASSNECDVVMAAIVGAAGLEPSLAAAKAGKKVLLANKEALVISGQLFLDAVQKSAATLLPIDSEHNAIFQCLPPSYDRRPQACGVERIILTASGGPFLKRDLLSFDAITVEDAIKHPKWVMGRKISVDSATMMNKGLEVIEAHWLFGASASQIEVVIHPQSVIHSMVSYTDGSVLAQMGNPDMRTPIAHALAYPERIQSGVAPLDLLSVARLEFEAPELERFPCLELAYRALNAGGSASAVLNAANEVAVAAFLDGKIGFRIIRQIIERVMDALPVVRCDTVSHLLEQDQRARELAYRMVLT